MSDLRERLRATLDATNGYSRIIATDGGKVLVNPDGPEAADAIDVLVEALTEAREHIHAMQHQARQYVEPSGYTSFDHKRIAFDYDQEAKDSLFTGDMIYLLDGPEQRAVEGKIDAALNNLNRKDSPRG